jgi:hypothetical protein
MKKRMVLLGALVALSGCSPSVQRGNEHGGMLTHFIGLNGRSDYAAADESCLRYGRVARVSQTNPLNGVVSFECVAP